MNESMLRNDTKKKMVKLYKEVEKSGGDIGDKVRKNEKMKEENIPNTLHNDNPFSGKRHIETFEQFCLRESKENEVTDKNRPMFDNTPKCDELPSDMLRRGNFIKYGNKEGQIMSVVDNIISIDEVVDGKHVIIDYDLEKFLKKIHI